jgi:hypothetical protein
MRLHRKNINNQSGFAAFEVIAGALIIAILIAVTTIATEYMRAVKAERRKNNPILNPKVPVDNSYKPSNEEFGSYTITFRL